MSVDQVPPVDEPIVEPVVAPPADDAHVEPTEPHDEPAAPVPDPRDAVIERLTQVIMERERQPAAPANRGPVENPLESTARKLGFGNVGGTDTAPGVNMIPALLTLLEEHGKQVLGNVDRAVSPRLSAIGAEIVGTKFERELAVRVQKQTPEFLAFRDAQLAKPGTLQVLRTESPVEAAELIEARWRAQRRDVKTGEERRVERLSGGGLQNASARGGNGAAPTLRVSSDDPGLAGKLCAFADAGGDRKNIKWLKRGEK